MANSLFPLTWGSFYGYQSNSALAGSNYLSQPSKNCLITEYFKVQQRFGYLEEFSIGVDGSTATAFYHKTYDLAFFALGTKVYYRDFTNELTVDTGMTLTAGTTTRFTEVLGDVYATNPTDGTYRIVCMRLNDAAATSGDAN